MLSLFNTSTPKESDEKKIDTKGIELAAIKNQSQSLLAGIRIVASAPSITRANAMLTTIKTTFAQFALIGSNSIVWNDVKTSQIHSFAKEFSFRTLNQKEMLPLPINKNLLT